jgi:hypothetical protein
MVRSSTSRLVLGPRASGKTAGAAVGVLAGVVSLTLLSGCSGAAKAAPTGPTLPPVLQGDPTHVVTAAAGRTTTAPNANVAISVPVVAESGPTNVNGEGAVDFVGDRTKLIVPNAEKAEERQIGRAVYVLLPEQAAPMLGGKQWVKLDLDKVGPKSPDPFNLYAFAPEQLVTALTAVRDAHLVGSEPVRDANTTHFTGTLDPRAVAAAGVDPTFARYVAAATKGAPMSVDVWLDDTGLIRKLSIPLPPPGATTPAPPATVELFDFGTADVSFTPPPADKVASQADLDSLGAGSGD